MVRLTKTCHYFVSHSFILSEATYSLSSQAELKNRMGNKMKRLTSFLVFCLCLTVIGSLLAITVSAQQNSSSRKKKKNQKNSDEDLQMNNPDSTNSVIRTPEELAIFERLIEQATTRGTARVIVGVRNFSDIDELLRQLAPFRVETGTRYEVIPYIAMTVDAAALLFMRESSIVVSVTVNGYNRIPTIRPTHSPEQLSILQKLTQQVALSGNIRIIVGVRHQFYARR